MERHRWTSSKAMMTDRVYYENQGRRALEEGSGFHCSEATTNEAVIKMARIHLATATNVLDVGCGANLVYDHYLEGIGKRPICIDFALNFLRLARKHACSPLVQADATALPFADASFDGIICSETMEHIPRDDCAVREIARVLRHRGVLLVTVPNLWNASRLLQMVKSRNFTIRMMEGHLREYTHAHLRSLLRPYFAIEELVPVPFGWAGKIGGPIDWLVRTGIFKRFSKSIAIVARRK